MTSNTSSQRQDEYLSRIALALTQAQPAQGSEPDDEDLAALLDNMLDATRRKEVISHLANNPALYQRWQQLLANHDLWISNNTVTSIASAGTKRRRWWQPAGGVTAAAAALFAGWLVIKPGHDLLTLDQAYQQFSPQLTRYLDDQPYMRALPVAVDSEVTDILAGIYQGQQTRNMTTSFAGIGRAQLVLASEEYQQRAGSSPTLGFEWGRWLLLSHAICSADPDSLTLIAPPTPPNAETALPEPLNCAFVDTQVSALQQRLKR